MQNQIEAFFFTNNGSKRKNNEDSLLVHDILVSNISMEEPDSFVASPDDSIFCVADGIGGERKGEIASNLVLYSLLSQKSSINCEKNLETAFENAKKTLDKYVAEDPDARNMGCTASGIIMSQGNVICFNIGDCRVYRIQNSYFEKVTHDHSIVQSLFDDGLITEDEMRYHPRKNAVTSSVSGDGTPGSLRIYMTSFHMRNPDAFFLCSDGIWECFSHDELEMIYQRFQGYAFCEKILTAALARRASDNISGILVIISAP